MFAYSIRVKLYRGLFILPLIFLFFSCKEKNEKEDFIYFDASKEKYDLSIYPNNENDLLYEFKDEVVLISNESEKAKQILQLEFLFKKSEDNTSIIEPLNLKHDLINADGSTVKYDSNKDSDHPFLKDIGSMTENKISLIWENKKQIKQYIVENSKTGERKEIDFKQNKGEDFLLAKVSVLFEYLPTSNVAIGESWRKKGNTQLLGFNLEEKTKYTLLSVDENGIATISFYTEVNQFENKNQEEFGLIVKVSGEVKGYYILDLENKRIVSRDITMHLAGTLHTHLDEVSIKIERKGRLVNKN